MERETVCLTESAGKGDLGNTSKVQMLEEELSLSKEENKRLQKLLDAVLQPQLRIHRAGMFPLLLINTLNQGCPNYGPGAKCGPLAILNWPSANSKSIMKYGP